MWSNIQMVLHVNIVALKCSLCDGHSQTNGKSLWQWTLPGDCGTCKTHHDNRSAAAGQTSHAAAQNMVDEIKAAHPEITSLELAAKTPAGCQTIAATEANEVGAKCDKDELTAWKTNRPFVEQEKDEVDVTMPVHDAAGKVIGTAGMDFKTETRPDESECHARRREDRCRTGAPYRRRPLDCRPPSLARAVQDCPYAGKHPFAHSAIRWVRRCWHSRSTNASRKLAVGDQSSLQRRLKRVDSLSRQLRA
jgi:hypothetical protein